MSNNLKSSGHIMKFYFSVFLSKCGQTQKKPLICSNSLCKSLKEHVIIYVVIRQNTPQNFSCFALNLSNIWAEYVFLDFCKIKDFSLILIWWITFTEKKIMPLKTGFSPAVTFCITVLKEFSKEPVLLFFMKTLLPAALPSSKLKLNSKSKNK